MESTNIVNTFLSLRSKADFNLEVEKYLQVQHLSTFIRCRLDVKAVNSVVITGELLIHCKSVPFLL